MSMSAKLRRAPLRLVTGAFVLNSGIGKLSADEETAKHIHAMASGTYPFLNGVNPKMFTKGLAAGEVAVGAAVLAPFVSPVVAGAALAGFSGALLNMYWNTPGLHEPGDPRPTQQGTAIAKDVWMFGIGAGLMADGLLEPAHDKKVAVGATLVEKKAEKTRRARRARKRAERANSDLAARLSESAQTLNKRARKQAEKAADKAQKRANKAAKRLATARAEYTPVVAERASAAGKTVRHLVDEYGPTVTDAAKDAAEQARHGAKHARSAAKELAQEYRPVVAKQTRKARKAGRELADQYGPAVADRAKAARSAAKELADEYGPVVAERAAQAREATVKAARDAADKVQSAVA